MKYEKLCKDILAVIGDTQNIKDVFHCVTRLRLILKNKDSIDIKEFEKIDGIVQVKKVGNQIQLIIGSNVGDVYEEFCAMIGFETKSNVQEDGKNEGEKTKANYLARLLDALAMIIMPIIPAIIAGGMIKGVVATIQAFNWLPATSPILTVIAIIGDAPIYFFPFLVGYTSAKRFKVNEAFGIMIAGVLMYPTILNATAGKSLQFLFLNIPAISYASGIFPTILSVLVFSYIFKFVDRYIPNNLKIIFSGFITFMITIPFILAFVAPLGNYISVVLSAGIQGLFNFSAPLAGALYCGFYPVTIIFGIKGWSPMILGNLQNLGYDFLLPLMFLSNIAVGGATLGASFKIKDKKNKSSAISTGGLCIIGVTEPALYGIAVKYKTPLYAALAGGAIGGLTSGLLSLKTYAYTMPGIFSLPTYFDKGLNIVMLLISLAVSFIASFAISFILTKNIEGGIK